MEDSLKTLWLTVISGASGLLFFMFKSKHDELTKLSDLLAKTRETMVTRDEHRAETQSVLNRMDARMDRLEKKIDDILLIAKEDRL